MLSWIPLLKVWRWMFWPKDSSHCELRLQDIGGKSLQSSQTRNLHIGCRSTSLTTIWLTWPWKGQRIAIVVVIPKKHQVETPGPSPALAEVRGQTCVYQTTKQGDWMRLVSSVETWIEAFKSSDLSKNKSCILWQIAALEVPPDHWHQVLFTGRVAAAPSVTRFHTARTSSTRSSITCRRRRVELLPLPAITTLEDPGGFSGFPL